MPFLFSTKKIIYFGGYLMTNFYSHGQKLAHSLEQYKLSNLENHKG